MMNDSVREELKDKISFAPKPVITQARPNPPVMAPPKPTLPVVNVPAANPPIANIKAEAPAEEMPKSQPIVKPRIPTTVKTHTTEIAAKPTSPTLVEFQNKNATLPDWRLQLQNAVRKRVENVQPAVVAVETSAPAVSRVHLPMNGANALKAEIIEEAAPKHATHSNPKLASALKRIEESRKRFLTEDQKDEIAPKVPTPPQQNKNYPFYIATKNAEILPKPVEITATAQAAPAKPKLEDLPVIEKKAYDTNKLKPLSNAPVMTPNLENPVDELPEINAEEKIEKTVDAPLISIKRVEVDFEDDIPEIESELHEEEESETEDLAPFAMRFNAGLFDLIIGGFTSLILLGTIMLTSGGNWYSLAGFLAFLVIFAMVMFVYLTTAIGMFGKTVGMKIFSLETIDIEENDYPTFHQAAVSSSVYLVSLALGGIGFLPALFNHERRTAPDLLSGTIVVKEY